MPTHQYVPSPKFPFWVNRLLAHPFEHAVVLLALMFGVVALAVTVTTGPPPSESLVTLPKWLTFTLGAMSTGGGVVAGRGLLWTGDNANTGWAFERIGLIFVATAMIVYALAVMLVFPESWFSWSQPLLIGGAACVRVVALILTKTRTLEVTNGE